MIRSAGADRDRERIPSTSQSLVDLNLTGSSSSPARNSRLENLEEKMAGIEASLKKRKARDMAAWDALPKGAREVVREIESLRRSVREKEAFIGRLQKQIAQLCDQHPLMASSPLLSEDDRKQMEQRLTALQRDIEHRKTTIKKLRILFEKLDLGSHIDVRIQQAEVEYQLEREDLNVLQLEAEAQRIRGTLALQHQRMEEEQQRKTLQDSIKENLYRALPENATVTLVKAFLPELSLGKNLHLIDASDEADRFVFHSGKSTPSSATSHHTNSSSGYSEGSPAPRPSNPHGPSSKVEETVESNLQPSSLAPLAEGEDDFALPCEESHPFKSPHGPLRWFEGVLVEETNDEYGIERGDRLLEINGVLVLNKCASQIRDEVLPAASAPFEIVLLRLRPKENLEDLRRQHASLKDSLHEAQTRLDVALSENKSLREGMEVCRREKDAAKNEQVRSRHRIAFLEDQVLELEASLRESGEKTEEEASNSQTATPKNSSKTGSAAGDNEKKGHFSSLRLKPSQKQRKEQKAKDKEEKEKAKQQQRQASAAVLDKFETMSDRIRNPKNRARLSMDPSASYHSDSERIRNNVSRPTPPKKPDRLSLYRATSVQSVDTDPSSSTRKRTHHNNNRHGGGGSRGLPSWPSDSKMTCHQQQQYHPTTPTSAPPQSLETASACSLKQSHHSSSLSWFGHFRPRMSGSTSNHTTASAATGPPLISNSTPTHRSYVDVRRLQKSAAASGQTNWC